MANKSSIWQIIAIPLIVSAVIIYVCA